MTILRKNLKGMSLVELLVAMAIALIVTAGMTTLFYVSWTSQKYQIKLGQASVFASRGVTKVVKNIRQAQQGDDGSYLLKSGDDFDIVFYGNIDGDGIVERVHYYLDNGALYMGLTDPSVTPPYSYPASDETVSLISNNVVNTATDFVFEYYDNNAVLLSTPVVPGSVRMVSVRLLVDVDPFSSPIPVTVTSRTSMRNLVND
jgi:prepilin-type N-terminal cleavage/methylation domain-containing protein